MQESKLRTQSLDFAVQIINLVKDLKSKHETVISTQIGRIIIRSKECFILIKKHAFACFFIGGMKSPFGLMKK